MKHLKYPPVKPFEPKKPDHSLLNISKVESSRHNPIPIPKDATHCMMSYYSDYDEIVDIDFYRQTELSDKDLDIYNKQLEAYKKELQYYNIQLEYWNKQEEAKKLLTKSKQEERERKLFAKLKKKYEPSKIPTR